MTDPETIKYQRPEKRPHHKLTDRQLVDKLDLVIEELTSRGIMQSALNQNTFWYTYNNRVKIKKGEL